MNIFSSMSQNTSYETFISRLVALLAIVVLSALPAVAGANTVTEADLFGGAEVEALSSQEMSETRGESSSWWPAELGNYDFGSDQWEMIYYYGSYDNLPDIVIEIFFNEGGGGF